MKDDDLYQKTHKNMIFSVYMRRCYKHDIALLAKEQRCSCPEKTHLGYYIRHHRKRRKDPRSSHRRCSTRKGVLTNFTKFTGKDLCQSLFFNKVAGTPEEATQAVL